MKQLFGTYTVWWCCCLVVSLTSARSADFKHDPVLEQKLSDLASKQYSGPYIPPEPERQELVAYVHKMERETVSQIARDLGDVLPVIARDAASARA